MTDKVQPTHRQRDAYVYVRQSSPGQLERNTESTRRQYGLVDRALIRSSRDGIGGRWSSEGVRPPGSIGVLIASIERTSAFKVQDVLTGCPAGSHC